MTTKKKQEVLRTAGTASVLVALGALGAPLLAPGTHGTARAQDEEQRAPLHPESLAFARASGFEGESVDPNHGKWIDVLSLKWAAARKRTKSGAVRRRGAAVVEDMALTMEYEKASPKLQEKCLKGEVIPKLEIAVTALYDGKRAPYLRYELENVRITSFQTNASGNDEAGPPTVAVSLNFEEIKVTYTQNDPGGNAQGDVGYTYDAVGNR